LKTIEVATTQQRVDCKTNAQLASGLLALALDLPMACGGNGRCATCHVLVNEGMENLSPIEAREERTLNLLSVRYPNSRLACQACVRGDVVVAVPNADYIKSADELELHIGKRAERDLLHAVDGRLLVARGQVVTRYVVQKIRETFSQAKSQE
jgi:ferredoxin